MSELMISLNSINSKKSSFYIQEAKFMQEKLLNYMKYFYKELESVREVELLVSIKMGRE